MKDRSRSIDSNSRKFPLLVDLIKTSTVTSGEIRRGFTDEQNEAQAELREEFPGTPSSGTFFPWYQSRAGNPLSATGQTTVPLDQGGMTIGFDVPEIGAVFRDALVLEKLGARILGGLTANVNLPSSQPGLSASWLSENAIDNGTSDSFAKLALSPYRVTASLDLSVQLVEQNPNAEAFLRAELVSALAVEIQRVAIYGSGTGQPLGVINTAGIGAVVGGANGAVPTYANLCSLEYAVTGTAKADRGNVGWLASPFTRKKLRQTFINGTGSDSVWPRDDAYSLLGHPAGVTPSVPDNLTKGTSAGVCSAIVCMEFSELFIGLWHAGIKIEVTRSVAQATLGRVTLSATAYVSTGLRQPTAAAVMVDALCA